MIEDERRHWSLDPAMLYLNHGSYGACPTLVMDRQRELRARLEAEPVRFFAREFGGLQDQARERVAAFLGCEAQDLVFVRNATEGVNTALRSLPFAPGDELLTTDHAYNACRNALDAVAGRAQVVVAQVPFPLADPAQVLDAVLAKVTPRTRLALLDHVTSNTALVFPIAELVAQLRRRGVETLVDGAHAPGMLTLALGELGAAYYAGNLHKWVCAPKGAGFLHVRRDLQPAVRPLVISHGANAPLTDRSRFQLEFEWTGTDDPTAVLCVPAALDFLERVVPGGLAALMRRNQALALEARSLLCAALRLDPPCPDSMIGAMASLPLPGGSARPPGSQDIDPLQERLYAEHRIEVPVMRGPSGAGRVVRISAQLYNSRADYQRLASALRTCLD